MKSLILLAVLLPLWTKAQTKSAKYTYETFLGTRIVNGHSVETLREGVMEMIIGHRFGRINGGAYELFGLDQAAIRIGLDYGVRDWLVVGVGRSSLGKTFDGFLKIKILRQQAKGDMPISLTAFSSTAYRSLKANDPQRQLSYQNRLSYTYQLLVGRKFGYRLSIQLIPTLLHFNLVETADEPNDKILIGTAAKYQISKNWAFTAEYYHALPDQLSADKQNVLSLGFDLNTGSHIFQLHFTNAAGMIEQQIGETTGNWARGDIHFGFNMIRSFKLKGRRY